MCVRVFGGALLGVVLQSALLLQGQALHMAINLGRTRLLLFENAGSSIPFPVLLVLVFWLIIFASFGLFAPRNATVVAAFLVTALPVSGAIFFILELDRSFEGILQVSSASLRAALTRLGGLCEQMAAIRPTRPAPSPPAKSLRGHYRPPVSSIGTAALIGTYRERTSRHLCHTYGHRRPARASLLRVASLILLPPVFRPGSRNFHRLHLISFGLTRACARAEALALRADASAAPPQRAVRGSVDLVLLGDGLSQTSPVSHA